jgi:hypothetical protein
MADDLKRSVQDMEAPVCPDCHVTMKWYRSMRVTQLPVVIDHFFQCDNCGRIGQTRGGPAAPSQCPPPAKLAPQSERRTAA